VFYDTQGVVSLSGSKASSQPFVIFERSDLRSDRLSAFEAQIRSLQDKIADQAKELRESALAEAKTRGEFEQFLAKNQAKVESLQNSHDDLYAKQQLKHLLGRVNEEAQSALLKQPSPLKSEFDKDDLQTAYVMSIDIRRSTELMLKARSPQLFASFITELCRKLAKTIVDNCGVFDKFTGDGILAFFPEFYSDPDAGFRVINAADECHRVFNEHYDKNRKCFISVLKDCGLGIGIDYGKVKLVTVWEGLTVVGNPVVYACRMGGAKHGQTFLNQPAYEKIFGDFGAYCHFRETEIDLKHEGNTVAYQVSLNGKEYNLKEPSWLAATASETEPQQQPDAASA
jgi:class 3 adenylate cyclase